MTNHWSDIGNASNVLVWGANPSENHPACMAHINRARAKGAKLVVVDPRKTRTALQADQYIRIRPGSDIALINGIVREIISQMEGTSPNGTAPAGAVTKFYDFLNQTGNGSFYTDGDATHASSLSATVAGSSKYSDARFLVNATGTDYQRATVTNTGATPVGGETANQLISNFPVKVADCRLSDVNTVYNRLKAHVDPYTLSVVADVAGCTMTEILDLVKYFIDNSRCSSVAAAVGAAGSQDPTAAGYKCLTMLYAMGITQHTTGSQNVKSFAVIQTLMGNMGRAGGGINALRGIHNVQGSTDLGLLNGNIPAYSSNPGVGSTFGDYMDGLWGNPLTGTTGTTDFSGTVRSLMDGSHDDAYNVSTGAAGLGATGLQQRGFFNMTLKFFGGYAEALAATTLSARKTIVDGIYDLWPKGNGDSHMTMFRAMAAGTVTKAAVVWGQNPAITEPNQGKVRQGLKNIDLLVCTDMFENETAACDRKDGSVTYLLPASAHVEHAGSSTNSGRTLQWRYRAAAPLGNSKDDMELLLRLAKALETAGAFSHIQAKWTALGLSGGVYDTLYGTPYDWTPGTAYDLASGTAELAHVRANVTDPVTYDLSATVTGSEWVTEKVFREMNSPSAAGGTIWIYTGAYNAEATSATGGPWATANKGSLQASWAVKNRAKSRDNTNDGGTFAYHGWGYAWLVNRRVFYNNADIPAEVTDYFMEPDSCSHLFVPANAATLNYSRWYRHNHPLVDKPDVVLAATLNAGSPHFVPKPGGGTITYAGRFPAHVEPYETPKAALAAAWGRNTKGGAAFELSFVDTQIAGRDVPASGYPLTLTTIRCVEHFQGGPITRNNWSNVELEPEPWIELNSADARSFGISDGDMVRVRTARSDATVWGDYPRAAYGDGFRARVGSGLQGNQRVAAGVVAIPWHWGEKGLSTGSRANDLCIDAGDANSMIPESKACLCKIEKM